MARYRGTTAQRGLGAPHAADRKRLLAIHRDGDPCWRCGQPMYKTQPLDRDHVIDRALGGTMGPAVLAHRWCNRAAGARLGNRLQPRTTMAGGRDTICAACGKVYSRAPRTCEICGAHYHPNHGGQRSCSRACGVALRRRIYGHAGARVAKPKPACEICGKPCKTGSRYCSKACNATAIRGVGPVASGERQPKSGSPVTVVAYYTCRYCGKLGVTRARAKPGYGQREVCPARECQLARLAANNLVARKGMTREQADAAVVAYRAEGDHRQLRSTPGQIAADRRWSQTVTAVRRATARASRDW